ncbi:MAG: DUF1566 domain-containing protein [Campylobacterota bacterium]|nr:DUF1566 domain-containing protein [Campylobacterota bacterium]
MIKLVYLFLVFSLLVFTGCGSVEEARYKRDSTTQIVTDTKTRLQWQDNEDTASDEVVLKWEEAIRYCKTLALGNYSDWRLADRDELYELTDVKAVVGKRKTDPIFSHVVAAGYWTDTVVPRDEKSAFYINTFTGGLHWFSKEKLLFVRCVRDE